MCETKQTPKREKKKIRSTFSLFFIIMRVAAMCACINSAIFCVFAEKSLNFNRGTARQQILRLKMLMN